MLEQLKLMLDAARFRLGEARLETDYRNQYQAKQVVSMLECLIRDLSSAITNAEGILEAQASMEAIIRDWNQ